MHTTSMPKFLKPTTGYRQVRLAKAARKAGSAFRRIQSVWGFGSAFRNGSFSDIDLLVVLLSGPSSLARDARHAKYILNVKVPRWHVPIDILVVTDREKRECPLRDMDQLELLFCRQSVAYVPRKVPRYGCRPRMI